MLSVKETEAAQSIKAPNSKTIDRLVVIAPTYCKSKNIQ